MIESLFFGSLYFAMGYAGYCVAVWTVGLACEKWEQRKLKKSETFEQLEKRIDSANAIADANLAILLHEEDPRFLEDLRIIDPPDPDKMILSNRVGRGIDGPLTAGIIDGHAWSGLYELMKPEQHRG